MNRLSLSFRMSLGLFALSGVLWAQTEIRVYQASLAGGVPVSGRLILVGDTLAFVDDERPEASFAVARSDISTLSSEDTTVTAQLREGVQDRAGSFTRLIVRLQTPAEGAAVQRWFGGEGEESTISQSDPASSGSAERLTFSAQRNKRMRSNTDGRLIVDGERIIFESTDNASESRRWELREIREVKLNNPYELVVQTFRGEKYKLMLSGTGMDNSQHREIVDRVTKARTTR